MIEVSLIPINFEGSHLEKRLQSTTFKADGKYYNLFCLKHGNVLTRPIYFSRRCYQKKCKYLVNYQISREDDKKSETKAVTQYNRSSDV